MDDEPIENERISEINNASKTRLRKIGTRKSTMKHVNDHTLEDLSQTTGSIGQQFKRQNTHSSVDRAAKVRGL